MCSGQNPSLRIKSFFKLTAIYRGNLPMHDAQQKRLEAIKHLETALALTDGDAYPTLAYLIECALDEARAKDWGLKTYEKPAVRP